MRNANPVLLITDDDRSFRETLADVFVRRGFETVQASCGDEAIEVAQAVTVHVALFDFHMPALTGLESIQRCREVGIDIPYILVTGNLNPEIAESAQMAEIFSLLEKPVSISTVTGAVREAMCRHYPWYAGRR